MIQKSLFKPKWWFANSHLQTIFPTLARRRIKAPISRIERLELPDGDFIDLAWAENGLSATAPVVIFLHGLGGSVNSHYAAGLMHVVNGCGWRAVLMHFRGASNEPNRLLRAYHSGDTNDLDYFLHQLAIREPTTKKAAVGVSLGGNVLLKWLGEQGTQSLVHAAVAVSVPFQLHKAADRIAHGFSRFYQIYLLRHLRLIFQKKLAKHAPTFPALNNLAAIRCFWTFDDQITAPLHGFAHVHEYYRKASSRQYLCGVATPTLIIHALDDPFMAPEIIPTLEELSTQITLEISPKGGHVGFIAGNPLVRPIYWLERRIPEFLVDYLGGSIADQ